MIGAASDHLDRTISCDSHGEGEELSVSGELLLGEVDGDSYEAVEVRLSFLGGDVTPRRHLGGPGSACPAPGFVFEEHGFDEFADGCFFFWGEVSGGFSQGLTRAVVGPDYLFEFGVEGVSSCFVYRHCFPR
ncbi:MAG: hypothetical protein EDR02_13445 [Actinobacteria bacterium]|nr:MAG: hypothetical protein EDR02_13445 [Actinomycetota bacterium]RIK02013.1 MAG: hypothetical protein DCC48_18535 [Acidobacteriota bacterium]